MNSSPKFTKKTIIKSCSGKTGVILDSLNDKPYYSEEHKVWLYPWSYGLGGTSQGSIPETMIQKYFEEVLMYELAHIFLGKVGHSPYTNLNERIVRKDLTDEYNINLEEWAKAQRKDNEYITIYAKTSLAEDLAETFHYWLALRYKKISKKDKSKILKTIPNRIQFLDDQFFHK